MLAWESSWQKHCNTTGRQHKQQHLQGPFEGRRIDVVHAEMAQMLNDLIEQSAKHPAKQ